MTKQEVLDRARREIRKNFDSDKEAAEQFGMSNVYLSNVLNNKTKEIPESILEFLGLQKFTTIDYRKAAKK